MVVGEGGDSVESEGQAALLGDSGVVRGLAVAHVKNGGGSGGEGLGRPMAEEVVACQGSDSERTISDGTGELPSFLVRSE